MMDDLPVMLAIIHNIEQTEAAILRPNTSRTFHRGLIHNLLVNGEIEQGREGTLYIMASLFELFKMTV